MSVKVYVWLPSGGKVGPSSMQVGDRAYVSLWPGQGRKNFVRVRSKK